MSHFTKRIVVACAAAGLAGIASAQGYLGLGVGQSRAKIDCTGADTCDKTDTAFRLYGGYQFNPYIAFEGSVYDQGKARVTGSDPELGTIGGDFKGQGFGGWAVMSLPVDKASFHAKVGAVSARVKLDASVSSLGSASRSERHTRAAWGLGAGYEFAPGWVGRADYERLRLKFLDEKFNVDLFTLGAHYRF